MCIRDQIRGWRHGNTCFLCFVQHDARVWKCLCDYFGLRKFKPWKTFRRSYLQRRKIEKRRQIEFSDNLRIPKLQENFTTQLSSWIIATRDSLFYKMFSPLFCFEQVKTLKNLSKKLFTSKTKKIKEEAETKSSVWDLKMANTLTNPRTVKRCETGMCIGLFSSRSQKTSNVVKTSVTHSPSLRLVCHSLFLTHFDVISDLLLNRPTATWNLFVKQSTVKASLILLW